MNVPRRKWTTLALVMVLVVVICACLIDKTTAYKRREVVVEDDDDDEDVDDDTFDFMSTKLTPSRPSPTDEFACDDAGAGECLAPPLVQSVHKRGLVTTKVRVKDIVREHARAVNGPSAYARETLGYVTPWNGRGYDYARQFRLKFDYIAPVWFQIREDGKTKTPILTGTHDIDRTWMNDVRGSARDGPKIVPRVMYERNRLASDDVPVILDLLVALGKQEEFDGFVFEIPITSGTLNHLLVPVGQAFQEANLLLLLVLTRSSNEGRLPVTNDMLDQLRPFVHRYTMNAYDFQTPGPNAPFDWIESTIESIRDEDRATILMGLPFYGYDNNDAIVGTTYIEQLKQQKEIKMRWDAAAHECVHTFTANNARHNVYFPCLQFLYDRLQLFQHTGLAGTAVWELGQGLVYFYDLL